MEYGVHNKLRSGAGPTPSLENTHQMAYCTNAMRSITAANRRVMADNKQYPIMENASIISPRTYARRLAWFVQVVLRSGFGYSPLQVHLHEQRNQHSLAHSQEENKSPRKTSTNNTQQYSYDGVPISLAGSITPTMILLLQLHIS